MKDRLQELQEVFEALLKYSDNAKLKKAWNELSEELTKRFVELQNQAKQPTSTESEEVCLCESKYCMNKTTNINKYCDGHQDEANSNCT